MRAKGVIRILIKYEKVGIGVGLRVYNLGFGDCCDVLNDFDDSATTNNGDRDKVLATVASTVLEFTEKHGQLVVAAEGVTPARTRLYQMAIRANLEEIEKYFMVYGMYQGVAYPFETCINYQAFFVIKK